ncbi:uncharacterized protein arhgef49 [Diretmus argenteus]
MPDVKPPPPCDYNSASSTSAGSPAGCTASFITTMDLEPCITNIPLSPDPLSSFPQHGHSIPHYPGLQGPPFPIMSRCNSSTLLTNLGLKYCSSRQGPQGLGPGQGQDPGSCIHNGNISGRPYRSMENLNWNTLADPGLYAYSGAPYRSLDSEFVFRYTATSHWYDGPPDGSGVGVYGVVPNPESLAFYPRRGVPRKDLPLFPQWLFPGGMDEWDARKGLREKLRLQSARSVAESPKPIRLRPQVIIPNQRSCDREGMPHLNPTGAGSRPLCALRITSPEEIKQEVLMRLQLRRQNSSPNLALHSTPESPKVDRSSYTTDNISSNGSGPDSVSERRRPPVGRLHIPTFEEFKRMRQKVPVVPEGITEADRQQDTAGSDSKVPPTQTDFQSGSGGGEREERRRQRRVERTGSGEAVSGGEGLQTASSSENPPCEANSSNGTADPTSSTVSKSSTSITTSTFSPIRTGPAPRSPLQPLAGEKSPMAVGEEGSSSRPRRSSLDLGSSVPFPPIRENWEQPSSCCPALLLEGTDLSSYGAKIYKMKDGLIGSALDLIKKRLGRLEALDDIQMFQHGQLIVMCLSDHQHTGLGCRRSSSDAAYEPAETVRAQRECRLRPHYSDPMPADAAKRKQLEMKIAAAARLHSQRRDRDKDRDRDRDSAPAAVRGRSEPRGEGRQVGLGVTRSRQHRWSTISSLSADSGVVGLSDDREEEDSEPRRYRRSRGADVERVDSGIGPGLARGWKRPSASLRAWEAQRPCPDCGQRDGVSKERGEGMCERCSKLRTERKEAILEFLNTESSYGEDLRIIKEEFYCPMQSAGLLTAEQLAVVFGNVQELIDVNDRFTEHLQDSIDQAFDQGDEDLLTVCIGEIFLEFVNMLPAFQTYCLQQSTSVNMLNALEKEKELLRIFLDVSQNDNTALRRMNLRSFLMAPLQRVTKYPLLLSRISKATTECHPDHARLREAKSRVESHLEHINMKTKQEGTGITWSLRSFRRDSRKNREVINIEMREVSMKTVGWARENTRFVMEGPLQLSQPADGQWVKKGSKALKFQNVQSLLMVRTQRAGEGPIQGTDLGARGDQGEGGGESIRDGVLVLIKDKSSGKFTVLREPIRLGNCVVSTDPDCEDTFEVLDIRRESFVFRASDKSRTQQWFRQVKRYARDLGPWRKRRNALPNIMINTNQTRS